MTDVAKTLVILEVSDGHEAGFINMTVPDEESVVGKPSA
jgi:hypothetical protein